MSICPFLGTRRIRAESWSIGGIKITNRTEQEYIRMKVHGVLYGIWRLGVAAEDLVALAEDIMEVEGWRCTICFCVTRVTDSFVYFQVTSML